MFHSGGWLCKACVVLQEKTTKTINHLQTMKCPVYIVHTLHLSTWKGKMVQYKYNIWVS